MNKRFNMAVYLIIIVVLVDQMFKWWILRAIEPDHGQRVNDFFNLVHVHNTGITFGLLNRFNPQVTFYFLVGTAVLILFFLGRWLWLTGSAGVALALALVMGGAIGNVIDRVRFGYVIDFLDFHWQDHHWYSFNIADSAIVTGVGLLLLDSLSRKR